jgi:tellurite methyltransferase
MNILQETFGNIDIYLFDQLLKGRYDNSQKVVDIGCGEGRNIVYFLKNGFDVYGADINAEAINEVKALSQRLAPQNPIENFVVSNAEDMPFKPGFFDLAICSAVLHFARDDAHFDAMLRETWRILKPGGLLFARLATDIGIEHLVHPLGSGRYLLSDGSERYLVNEKTLLRHTEEIGGVLYEPIKTTNVSNLRCMTTWCVAKK